MSLIVNLVAVFNRHVELCPDCSRSFEGATPELQLCRVGEELNRMVDDQAATEWLRQSGRRAGVHV